MKVYVTGATGFVGRAVVRELLSRGVLPRLLVRPGSEGKLGDLRDRVEIVPGDALDEEVHSAGLEDCHACIHLVGIIREHPRRDVTFDRLHVRAVEVLIDAMKESNVSRLVHMSALGTSASAVSRYHDSKWRGERLVKYSGLSWTILRPSVILGSEGEFFRMLQRLAASPVAPIPGGGRSRFEPVAVEWVARAIADAALDEAERFVGRTYEMGGGDPLPLRDLVGMIAQAQDRKVPAFLTLPMAPLRYAAALFERLEFFPVTRDQLTMLAEGSVTKESGTFFEDFGITRTSSARLVEHCVKGTSLEGK
jgi:uncharacterized protein YbjT (DUF2867 family)